MLTKEAMFEMVKEARKDLPYGGYGLCPECGVDTAPNTSRERRIDGYTTCGGCRKKTLSTLWKQAAEAEEEDKRTTGQKFVETVKGVGEKAVQGAAIVGGTVGSLGKIQPPHKLNERY